MKESILGFRVDACFPSEQADHILSALLRRQDKTHTCSWLACLNPHSYAVSKSDAQFAEALHDATWLVPDGVGIVIASRILGGSIKRRVTGSDVFYGLMERMNATGAMSVFFLGATEATLEQIRERMAVDYPSIRVAGAHSPPFVGKFSKDEGERIIALINEARPDVLLVAMTAPKQEKWIYENRHALRIKVALAIGAVFDFYAGRVKRSSPCFQILGLEWLPRLVQEPRRLWKRTFVSAPLFLLDVFRERLSRLVRG